MPRSCASMTIGLITRFWWHTNLACYTTGTNSRTPLTRSRRGEGFYDHHTMAHVEHRRDGERLTGWFLHGHEQSARSALRRPGTFEPLAG
jgi:hypothetical protein